ncbi:MULTISPECIES: peptidoglycan-associated lipoprotein Pal [Ramlibacter]|jgi:peptidoglycan-associated lipoprotein|uniref:Peptidoglycan-associated lipoprotein n=1 Tax=Ramlibacter pinisoli TaxID=2682844 RepID=A0A6N8IXK9_9BURK|nr:MULTISPECIES: peptidoglycan-associated lipoprotein Pal [Ramlibacter]MBA2960739.1 peptidoglycan-associated lipoprotein Pal [Ramlibacter sp. CGMCC 1.13660]MVQ30686.1 peptidoglycan-associated lipoprotein Pal [Ramlibacter pinisoli]
MYRRFLTGLLVAGVLAGCGSNVKLNDVPVEDRKGTTVAPQDGTGASTGPTTQSRVEPVAVDPNGGTTQGPANVARLFYFDYDSYQLKPEAQPAIDAHARFLKANPNRRVALEGHTDERGGREYNLALGQRRAEAVRRALSLLGVADNQMEAVSFGKEKPAANGSDEAAFAQNRRVEIAYR